MISHFELIRRAQRDGVDFKAVERDYVLQHILASVYQQPGAAQAILKGGTLLRMCHFEDYRYSADLDFSLKPGFGIEDFRPLLDRSLDEVRTSIGFEELRAEDLGKGFRIWYKRPGGRDNRIKVDASDDEKIFDPQDLKLFDRYGELPSAVMVRGYSLDEVLAEKLRCVMQRLQARDLFDLYQLLVVRQVPLDKAEGMFQDKARVKDLNPGEFPEYFARRRENYRAKWGDELPDFVAHAPDFDEVDRRVARELKKLSS